MKRIVTFVLISFLSIINTAESGEWFERDNGDSIQASTINKNKIKSYDLYPEFLTFYCLDNGELIIEYDDFNDSRVINYKYGTMAFYLDNDYYGFMHYYDDEPVKNGFEFKLEDNNLLKKFDGRKVGMSFNTDEGVIYEAVFDLNGLKDTKVYQKCVGGK